MQTPQSRGDERRGRRTRGTRGGGTHEVGEDAGEEETRDEEGEGEEARHGEDGVLRKVGCAPEEGARDRVRDGHERVDPRPDVIPAAVLLLRRRDRRPQPKRARPSDAFDTLQTTESCEFTTRGVSGHAPSRPRRTRRRGARVQPGFAALPLPVPGTPTLSPTRTTPLLTPCVQEAATSTGSCLAQEVLRSRGRSRPHLRRRRPRSRRSRRPRRQPRGHRPRRPRRRRRQRRQERVCGSCPRSRVRSGGC